MNYKEYSDSELMYMISESNEEAKNILFEKYKYIISIIFNKYKDIGNAIGLESSDLYQEALLGYTDAINRYEEEKAAKLATFITLCVERRIKVAIIKANRLKQKILNESYSLEYSYTNNNNDSVLLRDIISDNNENNPLENIMEEEELKELMIQIKDILSDAEYQVFSLLSTGFNYLEIAELLEKNPKSIDNTIQRLKNKIKKIINNREI